MTFQFGPYVIERPPLSTGELEEIGLSGRFIDRHLLLFLEHVVTLTIDNPMHGKAIAQRFGWKRDANVKKLRRCAWYLGIPVGSICVGRSDKDGYYWPRNAAEFQPTIDQYDGRFFAFARTRPHLPVCQRNADMLANQLRGIVNRETQMSLFLPHESQTTEDICHSAQGNASI
jgi:hypothetical protein